MRITETGQLKVLDSWLLSPLWNGAANVHERIDVYALGAFAYQLLTNTLPSAGQTRELPERLRQMNLVPATRTLLEKSLVPRAAEHYTSLIDLDAAIFAAQIELSAARSNSSANTLITAFPLAPRGLPARQAVLVLMVFLITGVAIFSLLNEFERARPEAKIAHLQDVATPSPRLTGFANTL